MREKELLSRYVELARSQSSVTFVGRLGTYRYLDMDVTIKEALEVAAVLRQHLADGIAPPAFVVDPLG